MRKVRDSGLFASSPGSPIHTLYAPEVSPSGAVRLVECGKEDINAYIQAGREETDIHTIMARVRAGELELLNKRPGSYGDFTKMPKTYAEVLQLQINAKRLFDGLDPEVRRDFDNDPNMFLAAAGTEEWYGKMSKVLPDEVLAQVVPKKFAEEKAAIAAELKKAEENV